MYTILEQKWIIFCANYNTYKKISNLDKIKDIKKYLYSKEKWIISEALKISSPINKM